MTSIIFEGVIPNIAMCKLMSSCSFHEKQNACALPPRRCARKGRADSHSRRGLGARGGRADGLGARASAQLCANSLPAQFSCNPAGFLFGEHRGVDEDAAQKLRACARRRDAQLAQNANRQRGAAIKSPPRARDRWRGDQLFQVQAKIRRNGNFRPRLRACSRGPGNALLTVHVVSDAAMIKAELPRLAYLLGLLAMIKCSICSYQCDN